MKLTPNERFESSGTQEEGLLVGESRIARGQEPLSCTTTLIEVAANLSRAEAGDDGGKRRPVTLGLVGDLKEQVSTDVGGLDRESHFVAGKARFGLFCAYDSLKVFKPPTGMLSRLDGLDILSHS